MTASCSPRRSATVSAIFNALLPGQTRHKREQSAWSPYFQRTLSHKKTTGRQALWCRPRIVSGFCLVVGALLLLNNQSNYELSLQDLFKTERESRIVVKTSPEFFLEKYKVDPATIWWQNYTEGLSRVYNARPGISWCTPESPGNPTHDWRLNNENEAVGLIYIKTYKASSSTCEGINWSIAHNVARRLHESKRPCTHYNRHVFQDLGGLQYRSSHAPSLVWTMVRHPIERDLSSFYFFEVSRKLNVTVTDDMILKVLRSYKNFQTSYLLPWQTNPWVAGSELWGQLDRRDQVLGWMETEIMDKYDFIGVTERFDESLAVMVLLFDLEPTDVIVLSAKQAGGYDDAGDTGRCSKIVRPPPPSDTLQQYWSLEHPMNNADFLLWEVANRSLDRTIAKLGADHVQTIVEEIRNLRKLAEYWCQHKAYFPCNARGEKQLALSSRSCYVQDAGCGYSCVDKVMAQYRRGELEFITKDTIFV